MKNNECIVSQPLSRAAEECELGTLGCDINHGSNDVQSDVELDSPNFIPEAAQELADRNFVRINHPQRDTTTCWNCGGKGDRFCAVCKGEPVARSRIMELEARLAERTDAVRILTEKLKEQGTDYPTAHGSPCEYALGFEDAIEQCADYVGSFDLAQTFRSFTCNGHGATSSKRSHP